ncbi:hypothetical protein QBC42DRAFT_316593, partial [Cladorrhinum samala]
MAAIAPMDLVAKNDPATPIPLKCFICPKKPNFSDVSHLLTHISSKSHLSNLFKHNLRNDPQSLKETKEYNEWYEQFGIKELLADRLHAKEQKKTAAGRRSRARNTRREVGAANRAFSLMKAEPGDYEQTQPAAAPWATSSSGPGAYSSHRQRFPPAQGYQTPNANRISQELSVPSTPEPLRSELNSEGLEIPDDDGDLTKLKGIIYPGMGLFDSASELQKRRRNQRKDESVLKNMKETSAIIKPDECVWDEDGDLQRVRDIYATPSVEGSPDRDLEERDNHKKKRGRRGALPAARRTSTRTTRKSAALSRRDHDIDDDSFNNLEEDDGNQFSSHTHGSTEGYDIFQDPPKRSPNTQGLWASYSPFPDSSRRFEYRRRPPLRPLNQNISLVPTATTDAAKPLSFFPPRESNSSSFNAQQLVSNAPYFPHAQHGIGSGNFNPLCQTRPGQFNPYGYPGYGSDIKPTAAGFQAINTMGPNFNTLSFNSYSQFGAQDANQERVNQDFD